MSSKLAVWAFRFAVFAVIVLTVVLIRLDRTTGWEGLNLLGASIMLGGMAVVAWWLAIALERYVADTRFRLALHPPLVASIFIALAHFIVVGFFGTPFEFMWRDAEPFLVLVGAAAVGDALVGFMVDRVTASRRSRPMA